MSIEALPVSRDDSGVITLRLEQPGAPVVVLDHPLIQRLEAALKTLPRDAAGLILASASERVFVAGADLKSIDADKGLNDQQLDAYLAYGQRIFGMLSQLPYWTAAAINGAVLGGGLELAMHCDGLVAAPSPSGKPYPVGLPEAGLSICPGWGGTNLLPARMDAADAIRRTAEGKPMTYDEAVAAKLFDAVATAPADLLATAKAWVLMKKKSGAPRRQGEPSRWIGNPESRSRAQAGLVSVTDSLPKTESAAAVAAAVRAGLESGWQAALDVERRELVRLRSTPAGRAAITAFFEKSKK